MKNLRGIKYLVVSLFLMLGVMGCEKDYHSSDPNTSPYMPQNERSVWKNGTSADNKEIWHKRTVGR